ncbi:MAG: DUF1934 domain-containing protein [Oscillospiraceae bacterium]|nr:DUF1934 domain-containing protein [Oscillospiraceae bacterium]
MKQRVSISMKGRYEADEDSVVELFTDGMMYHRDGITMLTYEESETTGFQGSTTTLKIERNGRVTLTRRGSANSHLVLQKGVRHVGSYNVYGGSMEIGVYANEVDCSITEEGGSLRLVYTLDMNTSMFSKNELSIDVRPAVE